MRQLKIAQIAHVDSLQLKDADNSIADMVYTKTRMS